MISGKQHQHTFKNYMHIQLSLSLYFYLLYLILSSCDRNDATTATRSSASLTHEEASQNVIDEATKLLVNGESGYGFSRVCVKMKGHHFEHLLK